MIRGLGGAGLCALLGLIGCRGAGLAGDFTPLTGQHQAASPVPMQPAWRREIQLGPITHEAPQRKAAPGYQAKGDLVVVAGRDGQVSCFRGDSGDPVWTTPIAGMGQDHAVFTQDLVLVGTDDGVLAGLDAFTGVQRWVYRVLGVVARAPAVSGERVVFVDGTNAIFGLDRATGQWRWQYRRDPPAEFSLAGEAAPAIADGRVFTGFSDGTVVALALEDGATLWTRDLAPEHDRFQDVDATPAVIGDLVVAASTAGGIYGLDAASGAVRWQVSLPGVIGILAIDGDVIVTLDRGVVARLSGYNGQMRWRTQLPGADGTPTEPVRVGLRYVAVNTGAGALHLLDELNGRPVRQFRPGSGLHSEPAVAPDGSLFVLSDGGILYALRPPKRR